MFVSRVVNLPSHMIRFVQKTFDSDRWPYVPAMDIAVCSHSEVGAILPAAMDVGAVLHVLVALEAVRSTIDDGTEPTAVCLPERYWQEVDNKVGQLHMTVAEFIALQHFYAREVFRLGLLNDYDGTYDAMWDSPSFQSAIRQEDES
jgi:hypothetical protein